MSIKIAMPLSQKTATHARRSFVVAPYVLDSRGLPCPGIPDSCILRETGAPPCNIRRRYLRVRKTGPRHALLVVKCRTHGQCFTLYPPGYAPYQRKPILQLDPEGRAVLHEESDEPLPDFEDTLFQAALDASKCHAWPRNADEEPPDAWWSTQGRHIELSLQLLGLLRDTADRIRETIAAVLSVTCLLLRDESRRMGSGYEGKGTAICGVLAALTGGERRAIRLLFCGYVTGKWGRPWTWDLSRRCLETLPFPDVGTTAPT